jgi:hemerythrin
MNQPTRQLAITAKRWLTCRFCLQTASSNYPAHEDGDHPIYLSLLTFLRDWLSSHMQKEDQEYGPPLKTHGFR